MEKQAVIKNGNPDAAARGLRGAAPFFQPKLSINQPGDAFEQEADHMAEKVMRMTDPSMAQNTFFKSAVSINTIQRIPNSSSFNPGQTNQNPTQTNKASTGSHRQIPTGPISRADFDDYVTHNFGVQDVHTGTKQEQEGSLTGKNSVLPTIPNWVEWSPGASSNDYSLIIKGIEDVAENFMAIPVIKTIKFYKVHYETNTAGVAVAMGDVGASFGAGELTVYEAYSKGNGFPIGRSNAQGNYPNAPVATVASGSTPDGAPIPYQGRDANAKQNIAHEMGHGIAEAAHAADPNALTNFNKIVGWVGTSSPDLYDIGQAAVQTAITASTTPPAQYKIAVSDWDSPQWIEQPMSAYAVTGPGDDFAESIAAFVYAKDSLKARSPKRFKFITDGMVNWPTQMKMMPPIAPPDQKGDFTVTDQMKHTG